MRTGPFTIKAIQVDGGLSCKEFEKAYKESGEPVQFIDGRLARMIYFPWAY
jgi:hypothetical protein